MLLFFQFFFYLLLLILSLYGYINNIIELAVMCCSISGMMVLRVVGIFIPPLGMILGFF